MLILAHKIKKFYSSQFGQIVIGVWFSVLLASISVVFCVLSFENFEDATSNLSDLVSNWEKAPITDLYLLNASSSPISSSEGDSQQTPSCPENYHLVHTRWPGTVSSACACPDGARYDGVDKQSSSREMCDGNQTAAGCRSQPTINSIPLNEWHGVYLCVKREGESQLSRHTRNRIRHKPEENEKCPQGLRLCGAGSYEKVRGICFDETLPCPITDLFANETSVSEGNSTTNTLEENKNDNVNNITMYKFNDAQVNWYSAKKVANKLPINEIKFVLHDKSSNSNRGGVCFGARCKSQDQYQRKGGSFSYRNDYPSECSSMLDDRWKMLDHEAESTFLWKNFEKEASCANDDIVDDYIETNVKCGTNPFSSSSCMMHGTSNSEDLRVKGCASDDRVCNEVLYQSNCGALKRWANQNDKYWSIMFRHEIYWKPSCEVSMEDVRSAEELLTNDVEVALLINLLINLICNFIHGFVFPIFISCFVKGYKCGCKNNVVMYQKYVSVFIGISKCLVALIAIVIFNSASATIRRAIKDNCADDELTQLTFIKLQKRILTSLTYLWIQFGFDLSGVPFLVFLSWLVLLDPKSNPQVVPMMEGDDLQLSNQEQGLASSGVSSELPHSVNQESETLSSSDHRTSLSSGSRSDNIGPTMNSDRRNRRVYPVVATPVSIGSPVIATPTNGRSRDSRQRSAGWEAVLEARAVVIGGADVDDDDANNFAMFGSFDSFHSKEEENRQL